MKILFGTRNKNKALEAKAIFKKIAPFIELISLDELDEERKIIEPIENGNSFYENSFIKAKYYFEKTNIPTICDDSGICVEALNGAPGIFSARFSKGTKYELENVDKANNLMVLDLLKNKENRKAHYECEIVYYDGVSTLNANGILNGIVLKEEIGACGFGYDPLFFVEEYNMTLGQMENDLKNRISHRFLALEKIACKLNKEFLIKNMSKK